MVQYRTLPVPDQEYVWIQSCLKRDLLRFPELESFKADNVKANELRGLFIRWDDIFVRWLRRFYRPIGIEVEHEPENGAFPIHFSPLPSRFRRLSGYEDVKPPSSLGPFELKPDRVEELIVTYGREGVVKEYLVRRFSELSNASRVWPRPLIT